MNKFIEIEVVPEGDFAENTIRVVVGTAFIVSLTPYTQYGGKNYNQPVLGALLTMASRTIWFLKPDEAGRVRSLLLGEHQ